MSCAARTEGHSTASLHDRTRHELSYCGIIDRSGVNGGDLRVNSVADEDATRVLDPLLLRARSRIGTTLREKWRLDALLGVGGMAAVYAATHRNGSRAAVKLLHAELSLNPQVRSRFVREGLVANTVGHEGAVKVLDDDVAEDGSLFLVTELLDGETLEERRIRSGDRLPEDDVLSIADQVLDVLAAAHAKGVVHRDLKPENVFITREGRVKILDFGIARLRELSTASTATRTGATMGTPAFMPPEQARGLWDEVDGRSDLWAVGATMFHLLSGRLVHEGRTTNEMLLSAMTKPAPPLGSIAPKVSAAASQVIDRALAFAKENRWLDATRMQEGVRSAYYDRTGAPMTTAPKLTVPETVPNRTLSSDGSAVGVRLPTTGQPVANSIAARMTRALSTLSALSPRARLITLGVGGAASGVILAAAIAVSTSSRRSGPEARPAVSVPLVSAVPTQSAPAATAAATMPVVAAPPELAATDLPTAATVTATPPTATAPAPSPVPVRSASGSPGAAAARPQVPVKANCSPPYVIDPRTGKKNFKLECL